jgi:hypothetical protein
VVLFEARCRARRGVGDAAAGSTDAELRRRELLDRVQACFDKMRGVQTPEDFEAVK